MPPAICKSSQLDGGSSGRDRIGVNLSGQVAVLDPQLAQRGAHDAQSGVHGAWISNGLQFDERPPRQLRDSDHGGEQVGLGR